MGRHLCDMYGAILLPVDGSQCAAAAADHAIELARTYDAVLHVLYVVDVRIGYADTLLDGSPDDGPRSGDEAAAEDSELVTRGEAVVEGVAARAREAGVDVVTELRIGDPEDVILSYIEEALVELVVMGTHGQSGLARLLLGSTAEYVLRRATVPVLTVRYQGDGDATA